MAIVRWGAFVRSLLLASAFAALATGCGPNSAQTLPSSAPPVGGGLTGALAGLAKTVPPAGVAAAVLGWPWF